MSEFSAEPKNPRRDWRVVFKDWKQSGKRQAAFCAAEGIPIASFSGALRRSRRAELNSPPGFVRIAPPRSTPTIYVDLPGDVRITLSDVDVVDLVRRLSRDA